MSNTQKGSQEENRTCEKRGNQWLGFGMGERGLALQDAGWPLCLAAGSAAVSVDVPRYLESCSSSPSGKRTSGHVL